MTKKIQIAPSLLAADFTKLGEELRIVDQAGADLIHMDIMDGHFVPNISYGPAIVKALRPLTKKPFDVHLMIDPIDYLIPAFVDAGADMITVHCEAGPNIHRTLQLIKSHGVKAGISLNPGTPASVLDSLYSDVDLILVMTVNPGFGGQSFIASQLEKITEIHEKRLVEKPEILIEVDGGITQDNAKNIIKAGADILVAGSSIFKGKPSEYKHHIDALRH